MTSNPVNTKAEIGMTRFSFDQSTIPTMCQGVVTRRIAKTSPGASITQARANRTSIGTRKGRVHRPQASKVRSTGASATPS